MPYIIQNSSLYLKVVSINTLKPVASEEAVNLKKISLFVPNKYNNLVLNAY